MSFAAQETSAASGDPVELYTFTVGAAVTRLTSSEDPQTFGGLLYTPASITRSKVVVGAEDRDDLIDVTLPSSNAIVRQFVNLPPGSSADLEIRRVHRSDGAAQEVVVFVGSVDSVAFEVDGYQARLAVAPLTRILNRSIPRYVFSQGCNHVLYGPQCTVSNGNHRVASTVSAVDGSDPRLITVTGIIAAIAATAVGGGSAAVAGGYVTTDGVSFRSIREGVGADQLRLWVPFSDNPTGLSIEVFAGCDHTFEVCEEVFGNIEGQAGAGGFGGYAFVPRENIFAKGVI